MTFSIDTFAVTSALRMDLGMLGYGVYIRLSEMCANAPNKRLARDTKAYAWDLRVENELIEKVVSSYGLFIVTDDYIEDATNKSELTLKEEKRKDISAKRSEAGKKSAEARRKKREMEQAQITPETPKTETVRVEKAKPLTLESDAKMLEKARQRKPVAREVDESNGVFDPELVTIHDEIMELQKEWNKVFEGSRRKCSWLAPPPTVYEEYRESRQCHEKVDFVDAFKQAKKDTSFCWTFNSAVREKNVSMLVGRADMEKAKEEKKNDYSNLPFEQRELLEYFEKSGMSW